MDLVSLWHAASAQVLPSDTEIWDSHTHVGENDPDGVVGTVPRLMEKLDEAGHAGAILITSREPGGYPPANDRILKEAANSNGRLIPYLRVDPRLGSEAVAEAERALSLGARGIKMHPRGESFALSDPTVYEVGRVAAAHGVPIMFHAGRGIPALGADALRLIDTVDDLNIILGHAGISDLSWIGVEAKNHPGLFFDTAWWSTPSILMLFATVGADRIVYASDTPYGSPKSISTIAMRAAAVAGHSDDAMRAIFGGNILSLVSGERPSVVGEPAGPTIMPQDPVVSTVYSSFHAALTQMLRGGDPDEAVSLAKLAVRVPDDHPYAEMFGAVASTMEHIDFDADRRSGIVRPMLVAASAVLTPTAPLPKI
jgi:predicted TIM-barrel fold metal-dependent hydrolase